MRSLIQGLTVLALAALLLLVWPCLIRESAEASEAPPPKTVEGVLAAVIDTAPAEAAAEASSQQRTARVSRSVPNLRQSAAAVHVTCDGNGSPLRNEVWSRAVYMACPPEAWPGW